ncbi:MAG: glycosyltransferase [Bacteroides sp.]|jgi:glycosyltransferase involved in cell wall biosynthesis|nr:glycosyltransferase [Bacteroides sp.]MCI1684051.1 glycosyltransferase [Bacteroides sp.]
MAHISFVLPAYKADFLAQAIDSILVQTYTDFELIIVNDASPDNLDQIISLYNDERIRYYVNDVNVGRQSLVAQWNHCISYAKGDYIVLASDDDLYHPDFLQTCVGLTLQYPSVHLVRARVEQIDTNNKLIGVDALLPSFCSKYEFFYYWMKGVAFTCIGNYMFKTSVLKERKFIDFPCAYGSDTASVIMMSDCGVATTRKMLFSFRFSSVHLSSSKHYYKEKLKANTMLFQWLACLGYSFPTDRYQAYYFSVLAPDQLYSKCKYDYYNLVIRRLPLSKFYYIRYCELLKCKDRCLMFIRFCFDKLFKR